MIVSRVRMVLRDGRSSAIPASAKVRLAARPRPGRSVVSPSVHDSVAFLWWKVLRPWGLSTLLCRCWWREAGIEQRGEVVGGGGS
jgi:hypothetical protein